MDDLISREQAINEAYHIRIDGDVFEVVQVETLMGLPSIQQWIPCSERLPDNCKEVLVTSYSGVYVAEYEPMDCEWYETREGGRLSCVTAWMPKPKPYKEEDNEID